MTLSIRKPEADALARKLANMERTTITEAVVTALREAIDTRIRKESPTETARRILARRRLTFPKDRKPVPDEAYHDLDHDLDPERGKG